METRILGRTGLEVGVIGLGTGRHRFLRSVARLFHLATAFFGYDLQGHKTTLTTFRRISPPNLMIWHGR